MPNLPIPPQPGHASPQPGHLKPKISRSTQADYQQALADFGVKDLLQSMMNFCDRNFDAQFAALETQEAEALAATLIQALVANLDGELLVGYLAALRQGHLKIPGILNLRVTSSLVALPSGFPNVEPPKFLYGDRLRWLSNSEFADWGIIIGRFYNFAPHRGRWQWRYLIWLDSNSPSATWVNSDLAWEDDLEPLEEEPLL